MNSEKINSEKKVYGTSVLDIVDDVNNDVSNENDFFKDKEYDQKEVSNMREYIKEGYNGETIKEINSTDALSGIKASIPVEPEDHSPDFDKIDESLKESDIQGKKITKYGRSLIAELIGEEPTADEELNISKFFESFKDIDGNINFDNLLISDIEPHLSDRIKDKFKEVTSNEEYDSIVKRFLQQIYLPYKESIAYRDDISELNKICREVDKLKMDTTEANIDNNEEVDKSFESLTNMAEKIGKALEISKNLDDRNKRLRQDYTMNDIDIKLYENVKECLDDAVNFISVRKKIDNSADKYRKDLKSKKDCDKMIESWIRDIKHDPHTLYTFPCNDYLSDKETREKVTEFFVNAYIVDHIIKNNIDTKEENIREYLLNINKEKYSYLFNTYENMAYCMLFILARTFKYNKVNKDDRFVRILSYTLDLISKLGVDDNRNKFIDISIYVWNKLSITKRII